MWEHFKTGLLAFLVVVSMLLTYALWSYQPSLENTQGPSTISEETTLDADQKKPSELFIPSNVIFHYNGDHLGIDKGQEDKLFNRIQQWPLSDFTKNINLTEVMKETSIEMEFATSLPLEFFANTLAYNGEEEIPQFEFNRIFIDFEKGSSVKNIYFVSDNEDETESVSATIKTNFYSDVYQTFINEGNAFSLLTFTGKDGEIIYVPEDERTLTTYTYRDNQLDVDPLKNILFSNPEIVKPSDYLPGETFYSDGSLEITVNKNTNVLQYKGLLNDETNTLRKQELLEISYNFTNDHRGFTGSNERDDSFKVFYLNDFRDNDIVYRRYLNHYPSFDENGITELYMSFDSSKVSPNRYVRPMIKLSIIAKDEETVRAGQDVLSYIEQSDMYESEKVEGLLIGYYLEKRPGNEGYYDASPGWFIKQAGSDWERIIFPSDSEAGGDNDAVESN
ncbi:hypothetical protein N781_00340 [Pontibacillus halophilus JSM 076056 = DSM 19796]|uniref:Regulatory protein YycH domain-containing protein n=2 Tax=Pontibacillus TaxID=289201 RepID=A0A0A5GLA9_9BACI|nr:hypothetical protein N781_00340 [Pontibacillus halophilus JSM 076056 = DSM 19796]